ncbi:MAG TPA: arginase [Chloroflexota bacterium]|nr:arginase [Chloroflexota bacterium]
MASNSLPAATYHHRPHCGPAAEAQTSRVTERQIDVLGVPMDLGADRRGVDMGPYAIRYAGLERDLQDMGRKVADQQNLAVMGPEGQVNARHGPKFVPQIEAVCTELRRWMAGSLNAGHLPLVLGGDHSLAIGSLAGLLDERPGAGVVWIDAHGDVNTPKTSPSGNVHGMPLAVALGLTDLFHSLGWGQRAIDPARLVLLGIRNLDSGEKAALRHLNIRVITMAEIDRVGVQKAIEEVLGILEGCEHLHLSIDMDAMDPLEAPGVATPWPGGLTYREAHLAMELLAASQRIGSLEVVEVNPIADRANQTGRFAEGLILSALGMTIL